MRSILVFVHIPRTGGTSLSTAFRRTFRAREILPIYGNDITRARDVVLGTPPGVLGTTRVIRGHFAFGLHEVIKNAPVQYITIVREPVSRVVSLYNYIRADRLHPMHNVVSALKIEEFVTSGLSLEVDNGQVRQLCGTEGEFPQECYGKMATPHGSMTEEHLHRTLYKLLLYRCLVGVTNNLQPFYNRLNDLAGINLGIVPNVNAAPGLRTNNLSSIAREVIMRYNKLDYKLWSYWNESWGVQ